MIQFTKAVQDSLNNQNWFAALFITLSLPDICGKIDYPKATNSERYKQWFENNLTKYTNGRVPFSAEDAWKFRCSCFHSGKNLELGKRIHFITPTSNNMKIHLNELNGVLQMQIDIFCTDVIISVESWWRGKNLDPNSFLQIYDVESLKPFIDLKLGKLH